MSFVAIAQYCASNLITKNLKTCIELLEKASKEGVKVLFVTNIILLKNFFTLLIGCTFMILKMIFLPESSDFMAKDSEETLSLTLPIKDNPFVNGIKDFATKKSMWVSMGIHESVTYFYFYFSLLYDFSQCFNYKIYIIFLIRAMIQKKFTILM
jgi:hypothetical protein